ncbi:MAG: hypothetical protein Kow0098_03380 [Ignavibacteriaceae bacterium]
MKLKPVRHMGNAEADLILLKGTTSRIRAYLVRDLNLLNKNVIFYLDEDDAENKYLYMAISEDRGSGQAQVVRHKENYAILRAGVSKMLNTNKAGYNYKKKIAQDGKPLFVFERIF